MWRLILLLVQDPQIMGPEPIQAVVWLVSGEKIELADVQVRGINPYSMEFHQKGASQFLSLFRLSRINRGKKSRDLEIHLDSGEILKGHLGTIAFTGIPIGNQEKAAVVAGESERGTAKLATFNIHQIKRIHFLSGNQLRSCLNGHYEQYTPYSFCPVCGNELIIGHYPEEFPEKPVVQPKLHRLRLDPRTPTPTTRRGQ